MVEAEQSARKLPDVFETPYKAVDKSTGETCICMAKAFNELTGAAVIVYGRLTKDSDAVISYVEEDKFYELFTVEDAVSYDYQLSVEQGVSNDTAGGSSVVMDKDIPTAEPEERVCKCGEGCGCGH